MVTELYRRRTQIDAALARLHAERERRERLAFPIFLRHWHFKNRESGAVRTFVDLWPGQERLVEAMLKWPWLLALKAGKLGFTELACAYDGWIAACGVPNARVHLFSKNGEAARDLLAYVRFGLRHLPPDIRPAILGDAPGGDTVRSLRVRPSWAGPDDVRIVMSYNTERHVSVDQTAAHVHCDELWTFLHAHETWSAIASTVAPGGSCHIITRGGGETNYVTDLWTRAQQGGNIHTFFEPWMGRPDRDRDWYAAQEAVMTHEQLARFAPETAEDALHSSDIESFVTMEQWDACRDGSLPELQPDSREAVIIGVDAASKDDTFAVVLVTRHPHRSADPAIRRVRKWEPGPRGEAIDFWEPETFIRWICKGGCPAGHPLTPDGARIDERYAPRDEEGNLTCDLCLDPTARVSAHAVYQLIYDPSQMHDMAQRFVREGVVGCQEFNQGTARTVADRMLYDMIISRRLAHDGNQALRQHVGNAAVQLQAREDSRMRIVKRSANGPKIDIVVAASMAIERCQYYLLEHFR